MVLGAGPDFLLRRDSVPPRSSTPVMSLFSYYCERFKEAARNGNPHMQIAFTTVSKSGN